VFTYFGIHLPGAAERPCLIAAGGVVPVCFGQSNSPERIPVVNALHCATEAQGRAGRVLGVPHGTVRVKVGHVDTGGR
jgi:hypothetical protein